MPISLLRLVGLVFAIVLVLVAIGRLRRRGAGSRVPATGLLAVGLGLFAVALFPDLVRPIQDVLGLAGEPLGRLVTVLVDLGRRSPMSCCSTPWAEPIAPTSGSAGSCGRCRPPSSRPPEARRWGGVLVCIPALDEAESLPAVLAEVPAEVAGLVDPRPGHRRRLARRDGRRRPGEGRPRRQPPGQQRPGRRAPDRLPGRRAARRRGRRDARRRRPARSGADGAPGRADRPRRGGLRGRLATDGARARARTRRRRATPGSRSTRGSSTCIGGTEVSDIANGYRAIRASRLAEIAFTEDQFHNPELLLGAARAGLRVVDVPVTIRRRTAGDHRRRAPTCATGSGSCG